MMYNANLYIVAAGKGSRMGGNVPKALVPITDEPNLTTTLKQVGNKFQNVFVVTNEHIQDQWVEYFSKTDPTLLKNVKNISINSGLGDGHAVREALYKTTSYIQYDVVVAWGDVFFPHAELIDELMSHQSNGVGLVPAVTKSSPYVTLLTDDHLNIMSADFSKYGESHPTGFHDQSIFRFNRHALMRALDELHYSFWKNGRYITPGGELSTLYVFHRMWNTGRPAEVYETDYPTLSFNDKSEVAEIQKAISEKWNEERKHTT